MQLLKSVLSSLHTYWASVFILPKAIIKVIEGKMRAFLWKGSSGIGYAKVSWVQVCKPKKEGGLGIHRVLHMNQALMLKHVWRILQEDPRSIWVAWVLKHRLRNQTIWTYNSASASWCWRKLIKGTIDRQLPTRTSHYGAAVRLAAHDGIATRPIAVAVREKLRYSRDCGCASSHLPAAVRCDSLES
ncbi:UNVERIFIED_CONTAM: hypothetical protein Slati_4601600, partial [Sesamum latifolium]